MRLMTKSFVIIMVMLCAVALGLALSQAGAQANKEKLMNPATLTEKAPDTFQAKFDTTKGTFLIEVTRAWAPAGADRFYNLVKNGYYDDCRFFRVVARFMVQFGINGDPKLNTVWSQARIKDDKVLQSNKRGYVYRAMAGPNTRTTQLFINFGDNAGLDSQGVRPLWQSKRRGNEGCRRALFCLWRGAQPGTGNIQMEGNAFLDKNFPKLDSIKSAVIFSGK